MTPQYFKGDATEKQFDAAASPIFTACSLQLDDFFEGAYSSAPLGDILVEDVRAPLANAIPQDIFRASFTEIFQAFVEGGTFESYLTVFKKIFGDAVVVAFTVPAAGKLQIDITSENFDLDDFIARQIESNAYVFYQMQTQALENLIFQSVKGFTSEYELEQMLFEMVPGGIFTQITLDV